MTVRVDVFTRRMFADSEDELHAMALRVGASMAQFNEDGRPYYDLEPLQTGYAVAYGAEHTSQRQED